MPAVAPAEARLARSQTPRPTDAELAILRVLWDRGPATVREVWERLSDRRTGYTTTLKLMQIMTEKGLLVRDERRQTHVYSARHPQQQTQKALVKDLLDRAFGGSAPKLILGALSAKRVTPEELAQIRKMLDELEGEPK